MNDSPPKEEKTLPTKDELVAMLSKPLDPDLDYFDATPCLIAIAEVVRNQHRLIEFLFETMGIQGNSILQIREMQAAQKGAIEFLADMVGAEKDAGPLVDIKAPALVNLNGEKLN